MVRREGSLRLGDIAVRHGLLRNEQVARCLAAQRRLRREGVNLRLGQLMVRDDLLSTTQLVRLLEIQRLLRDEE